MRNTKRYILTVFVCIFLICTGCSNSKQEVFKPLENLTPIAEVRKNVIQDLETSKVQNRKLFFDNIIPYVPETDILYDIQYDSPDTYKNIDNEADMLEEQFVLASYLLEKMPESFETEKFETGYYNFAEKGNYSSFADFMNDSVANQTANPSYLYYVEQDIRNLKVLEIHSSLSALVFNRGACYQSCYDYRMKNEIPTLTQPRFNCNIVKSYYVYEDNNLLNDIWKLKDGELSVREGIDFMENYMNHEIQLDGEEEEIQLKVELVQVLQINKDYYCFRYLVRRSIGGPLTQAIDNGSTIGNPYMNYEMGDAYQVETNKLDIYSGPSRRLKLKRFHETTKILSLADAISFLEQRLGENSIYQINQIELGYLMLFDEVCGTGTSGTGNLSWVFRGTNKQDRRNTDFFVNAQTGEIFVNTRN